MRESSTELPTLVAHTIRDDTAVRHLHKYTNRNPLQRVTLGRFFTRLAAIMRAEMESAGPDASVFEFGCGEGFLLRELKSRGFTARDLVGIDLREQAISEARTLHPEFKFECVNLFDWSPPHTQFDVVLASQVLEHIPQPAAVLKKLIELTAGSLILTVPCEPWFQLLNLARGRDIARLGNHPEHINRWSKRSFEKFVSKHARILSSEVEFPFIVVQAVTLR